ncbi:hypothetical protein ABW20_dc0105122 [Dactylellina cionopaga]|nr:hypothetical protein ABW20_dc0105122 [Dactylellina cionopaga]
MSTPSDHYSPNLSHDGPPSRIDKGKQVERPPIVEPQVVTSILPGEHSTTVVTPQLDQKARSQRTRFKPITISKASSISTAQKHKRKQTTTPLLRRLFFCFLSSRPKYTKIQHLVIPTSQVCVDSKALRFLQSLPREHFHLLTYIVQEVFTDDGVKVLGRIPDYDDLIEAALKGQIRTAERPWVRVEREGYVEHVAGLYARLLRKMGSYERAPVCEKVYGKKYNGQKRL